MTNWQTAIWITLVFVMISIGLQYLVKRNDDVNVERILEENKKLSDDIMKLHDQIATLNRELLRLYNENRILSEEVDKLSIRVNNLQSQVLKVDK